MDKIARVRQEVGRLMELNNASMESTKKISRINAAGYYEALVDVENFLDTLSEEPDIPEFPETFEICLYDGRTPDKEKCAECSTTCSVRKEEPDKSLEEAAIGNYYGGGYVPKNQELREIALKTKEVQSFIAGAEWQASQMPMPEDTVLFQKGVAEGRRLEMDDMLGDAISCEVYWYDGPILNYPIAQLCEVLSKMGVDEGDKVRIVVLKAEEK